jgi:hypothetical protein
LLQRTRLNGFVASALKSKDTRSVIRKIRPIESDSCLSQKPRTQLNVGARLPKLKPVEVVKAAAFK